MTFNFHRGSCIFSLCKKIKLKIIRIEKDDLNEKSIWNELVFNKSFFHKFNERLDTVVSLNVCDIGSGFPARTILLREKYCLRQVVCVDSKSEKELVRAFITKWFPQKENKGITTFSEYYFHDKEKEMGSIEKFNDVFLSKSYFKSDVDDFLNQSKDNEFDLLLCANFFHLFEDINYIENLLDKIKALINLNTVLFFQVEEKEWFNYELYLRLINKKFNGTVFELFENNTLKESCFINIK